MVKVLVADDSDAIRFVLKEILSLEKHTVTEATNGEEAVDKFFKNQPDVLILDLSLPKKDGFSVIKEIISKNAKAKILVLSGTDDKETIDQCLNSGALAHIAKPFNHQKILEAVTLAVSK